MCTRHLPRKAFLFQLCCSRRCSSFKGDLQATSSSSLFKTEPSAANGLLNSTNLNLRRSPRRFFSTRSAADGYLLELLKSEIEQNKQKLQPQNVHGKGVTVGPFVLTDKPGTEDVVLSRTEGSEKIEILCMLEKQYPEDEDEVEEQKLQHRRLHHYNEQKHVMHKEDLEIVVVLHMSVTLSKGDVRLELDCSFVQGADDVMIEDVLFHESDPSMSTDGAEPYGGPIFEDLDENLQQAFLGLLKDRGITVKVARYMLDYMSDKGQREYIGWLHRLNNFLTC